MIRKIQRYAKTFMFIAVGSGVLWVAYSVHTVSRTFNTTVPITASNINSTLDSISTTVGTLNTTLATVNSTVAEAKGLIADQRRFQEAQNQQFLAILQQGETALENAQNLMYDIQLNQGKLTDATVAAVNKLTPVLENTAKAAEEASKTISDPKLKETMTHMAEASQSAAVSMKHVESVTVSLDDSAKKIDAKVTEVTKPASFIRNVVMHGLSWGFGLAANVRDALGK